MSGIVAVFSDNGRSAVPRAEIDALVQAYTEIRGPATADVVSAGEHAYCAKLVGRDGEGIVRDGAAWSAVVGKLHSRLSSATAALAEVEGQFAAVRYDGHARVEVFNDPFGMQALFEARRHGRTYVSTSATALARHLGVAADEVGAAMFLLAGRQFGPSTHWQGVRRLDPATLISFSSAGTTTTSYWRPEVDQRVRSMSFPETADHCARVLLTALESRLAGEPCLQADITGGYDSRLIAAGLARLGLPFTAQTSGDPSNQDVVLGREVALVGGFDWRHDHVPETWRPTVDDVRTAAAWSDGTLDVLQLSEVLQTQQRRSRICDVVVTGGAGEHFGPSPWLHEFIRAGRSREINFDNLMSMRSLTPLDFSVLREDPRPVVDGYMRRVLKEYAGFLEHELNTTQLDAVFVYRGVGHFGAYRSASELYVRTEIPVYYRDVFTAAFSSNHRYRNGHRLHRAIISRIHPEMSRVQTTHGGPAQRVTIANAHRFAPYYAKLARTALRKIQRRSARQATPHQTAEAYRHAVGELERAGVLDPSSMRSGHLYDADRLSALTADAKRADFGSWTQLGRIVTLELALRNAAR